ncbi:MAG TPA: hypothetical protein VLT45_03650 [Kofleriaceae bacterium]|nr:hypothetical protein [Kofleriaceae bacterium]
MKKLLSIGLVGGVAVVSACFGDGPTPTAPSGATVLFSTEPGQSCNAGTYIGPIAFGSDHVYVSFLPYQPVGGSCHGGGGNIQAEQSVFAYPLAGGTLDKIGSAGETNGGTHVQLAATGSGVAYAYNEAASTSLYVEPGHVTYQSMNGTELPIGMFAFGSDLYVGAVNNTNTTGGLDVTSPTFPNGGVGSISNGSGQVMQVGTGMATPWTPSCGGLDRCLVANGSSFTYVAPPSTGGSWTLLQQPLSGGSPTVIATSTQNGQAPLGLDTDDHQIAWSTTESCVQPMGGGSFNCAMYSCNVLVYDTTAAMPKPTTLLSTQKFACVDAKLANGYVYFAIVALSTENQQMIGRGIGRVAIADRTLETLDLGIETPTAGPRRIFPVGDQLFLVDPFVLARIDASALNGKHDFTP